MREWVMENKGKTIGFVAFVASLLVALAIVAAVAGRSSVKVPRSGDKVMAGASMAYASESKPETVTMEPAPLIKVGVRSFKDVLHHIDTNNPSGYGAFVKKVAGLTRQDVVGLVVLEKKGYNLRTSLPVGTVITNTGVKGGYQVYQGFVLKRPRVALSMPGRNPKVPGKPVVLTDCGNPMRLEGPSPRAKRAPPRRAPPREECKPLGPNGGDPNASQADGRHTPTGDGSPKHPSPDGKSHKEGGTKPGGQAPGPPAPPPPTTPDDPGGDEPPGPPPD